MMKKRIKTFILFAFSMFCTNAQDITSLWIVQNYTKREVLIPMRDGSKLFTAIYEPKNIKEKEPIILLRTPYSIEPYGKNNFTPSLWKRMKEFTRNNYIIVYQDVRGRYMSEGVFEEVRPLLKQTKKEKKQIDESTDSYDTVDWLLKHTHNNGKVGALGSSYGGFYTTMVAYSNHPAVKAVSPQAPINDWFLGDDIHHNGALMLVDAYDFLSGMEQPRPIPCEKMKPSTYKFTGNLYDDFLRTGAIRNFTALTGGNLKFWNNVINHPNYDTFWQLRSTTKNFKETIKPAVLIVGGQFDAEDLSGTLALYENIKIQSPQTPLYFIYGPWSHGAWNLEKYENLGQIYFGKQINEYFEKQIIFPFFNHYLKGEGQAPAHKNIFFTGINRWITDNNLTATKKPFYFCEGDSLSFNKPLETTSYSEYLSDPKHPVPFSSEFTSDRGANYMVENQYFASQRPDVLTFRSQELKDTLTLAGPVEVELYTSISTTDADFVVKLIDVYPTSPEACKLLPNSKHFMSGYQMLVKGDVMRGKYRDSYINPQPFEPNKITNVKLKLEGVTHSFLPGHCIMVQVQSSWFPLVDRNPQTFTNIYTCKDSEFVSSNIRIYHQKSAASNLILPVVEIK